MSILSIDVFDSGIGSICNAKISASVLSVDSVLPKSESLVVSAIAYSSSELLSAVVSISLLFFKTTLLLFFFSAEPKIETATTTTMQEQTAARTILGALFF